jgi:hypothetical protein
MTRRRRPEATCASGEGRPLDHSVECVDLDGAEARAAAWRDLCSRALEANAFAEPAFVLSYARHIALARLEFLFVWQDQSRRRLVAAMAIEPPRLGVARVWQSDQAGLAAIAFDRDVAATAFESVCEWLCRERPRIAGLLIPTLAERGETASLLAALATRQGRSFFFRSTPANGRLFSPQAANASVSTTPCPVSV